MRRLLPALLLATATAFVGVGSAQARLVLAPLFADGAVLQRDQPLPVWGRANPDTTVEVRFAEQHHSARADASGRWQVVLFALPASLESRALSVSASDGGALEIRDVLVGDLWLLSGQSNIAWPLERSARPDDEPVPVADRALRQLTVDRVAADQPRDHVKASWIEAAPDTATTFGGLGYYFGRQLRAARPDVPVGLVLSAWGGTPIEAWMPRPALEATPEGRRALASWQTYWSDYQAALAAPRAAPAHTPAAQRDRFKPSALYHAMVHPFMPGAFRGVIWYQGESNALRPDAYAPPADYAALLRAHIASWRAAFAAPELPFLVVQLPRYRDPADPSGRHWSALREAQAVARELPATVVADILDLGDPDDLHPTNKHDVGRRLARAALASETR